MKVNKMSEEDIYDNRFLWVINSKKLENKYRANMNTLTNKNINIFL